MSEHFEVVGLSSPGADLEEVHKNEGIRVEAIEMSRQITPVQDLISLWKVYRFLKKEKAAIVHTHTPKAGIIGMLAARLAGVPHRLHTVAGLPLMEAKGTKRKLLDFVEKLTYRCATRVYPNSRGLYDFILQEKYTSSAKLKVIGEGSSNGIDTAYFSAEQISEEEKENLKRDLGISREDFVFVFVGRLVGDKGINELVSAFSSPLLGQSRKLSGGGEAKLLLVGPLESELDPLKEETLQAIQTHHNILATGFQGDVRPYLAISDCLVFPSYREGFPNVVMQAGAMGLPSIVSDINGCNEIIQNGENGWIVPVKDANSIKTAMQRMISDREYCLTLKQNARKMIAERYEQNRVWEALLEEYRKVLGF